MPATQLAPREHVDRTVEAVWRIDAPKLIAALSRDAALDVLYLDESRFFRAIDLAVVEVGNRHTDVFVRVSGHAPSTFEHTWNAPASDGPFKQLLAAHVRLVDD